MPVTYKSDWLFFDTSVTHLFFLYPTDIIVLINNNQKTNIMKIKVEQTINKNSQEVWEVMGNEFGNAHLWSSNFKTSKPGGEAKFAGLAYSLRDTTTERGNTIQELTAFDASELTLTYKITTGAPEIAKSAGATWSLSAKSKNLTVLSMDFFLEPKMALNPEMKSKLEMGLTASVKELAEELKYYLENGEPHPNNSKI